MLHTTVAVWMQNRKDLLPPDPEVRAVAFALNLRKPVTNKRLSQILGVSEAEASKRASKCFAIGLINRKEDGRRVLISLA
jgi:Mn-dependent DtxR family transcriptional regulator